MSLAESSYDPKSILSLHIRHPREDLLVVSKELGVEPFRIWKAGDLRTTPKGAKLEGTREGSYCAIRFDDDGEKSLSVRIQEVLEKCKPHLPLFERLMSSGGSVSLAIGWLASDSDGETFDWKLLKDLGAIKFSLELYIYRS